MKPIHSLKARWPLLAMLPVTALGATLAWQISRSFHVRFDPVAIAAVCGGLTPAIAAWICDGRE